jgi:hypothetical protein
MGAKLTTAEAAVKLRRHPGTLRNWRVQGKGPGYTEPEPGSIYYDADELDAYLNRNRKRSTTDGVVNTGSEESEAPSTEKEHLSERGVV